MKIYIICSFLFSIVLITGCATYPTIQRPIWDDTPAILSNIQGKTQDLTLGEILEKVISHNSNLFTLRSNVEMTLTTPDDKGPIRCTGIILYESPKSLRVIGSKFATTLFDLSSDGSNFRLYIPLENKVYTGNCNTFHKIEVFGINIFPGDMVSLFNYKEILEAKRPILEIWPAYWLIHMLEVNNESIDIKGNLLIDRIHVDVFRRDLFNPDGSVRLQAVFTDYITLKECRIPQRIHVRCPGNNAALSITFSNITVNGMLDPKVFTLSIPKEVQIVILD